MMKHGDGLISAEEVRKRAKRQDIWSTGLIYLLHCLDFTSALAVHYEGCRPGTVNMIVFSVWKNENFI